MRMSIGSGLDLLDRPARLRGALRAVRGALVARAEGGMRNRRLDAEATDAARNPARFGSTSHECLPLAVALLGHAGMEVNRRGAAEVTLTASPLHPAGLELRSPLDHLSSVNYRFSLVRIRALS